MTMPKIDTALCCLVRIASHFSIPADLRQLERAYIVDENPVDTITLLGAAKDIGLKARLFEQVKPEHLTRMPHPAAVRLKNGTFVVLLGADNDKVALYDPNMQQPQFVTTMEMFCKNWDGAVILFAKRFQVKRKLEKFGFSWFLPVVMRYKSFLGKVLLLSLYCSSWVCCRRFLHRPSSTRYLCITV